MLERSNNMQQAYHFTQGNSPLLISMPHSGLELTADVRQGLVAEAQGLNDTDWHIPELYRCAQNLGANVLSANYSRYVIDLNRSSDDIPLYTTATTGLFPEILFNGSPLFKEGLTPSKEIRQHYLESIWQPYHLKIKTELERLKQQFGYALLWDAHSIRSEISYLFDGKLPDFNLGTNSGLSCDPIFSEQLIQMLDKQNEYTHVLNGRFKGGFITRNYGDPQQHIHAIQLEMSQATYMDEQSYQYLPKLATPTSHMIELLLKTYLNTAEMRYHEKNWY